MALKAIIYADIFNYPLTKKEINKWLIQGQSLTGDLAEGQVGTAKLEGLSLMGKTKSYYHLPNRSNIISLRQKRYRFSQLKLKKAKKITKILSFIPSIELIALTGALAMNNSDKNDDIDLMIVTKTNSLWLTRLLTIFILELLRSRRRPPNQGQSLTGDQTSKPRWFGTWEKGQSLTGDLAKGQVGTAKPEGLSLMNSDKICLNLWLDKSALAISKSRHNLYTAHEVCQIKPLYNKNKTYERFLSLNSWVKNFLPNALGNAFQGQPLTGDLSKRSVLEGTPLRPPARPLAGDLKGLESVPGPENIKPSILNLLNLLAFKLQYAYMKSKITNEKVSLHSAFFHPRPTGKTILKKYKDKIRTARTVLNRD
ncbi:MAG: hypothetical protein U9Q63_00140 [Patescibacteria group bacterium]|nr:hypothetical protein [Patescibacteria group bacterium]